MFVLSRHYFAGTRIASRIRLFLICETGHSSHFREPLVIGVPPGCSKTGLEYSKPNVVLHAEFREVRFLVFQYIEREPRSYQAGQHYADVFLPRKHLEKSVMHHSHLFVIQSIWIGTNSDQSCKEGRMPLSWTAHRDQQRCSSDDISAFDVKSLALQILYHSDPVPCRGWLFA